MTHFKPFCITWLFIICKFLPCNAQSDFYETSRDTSYVIKNFKSIIRQMVHLESPARLGDYIADAKNLNTRAIKDFHMRFAEVENALWYLTPAGFEAYFVQDGFGDRVFYDKRGRWQCSMITYGENKLPKDLRAEVRSRYFDLTITLVEECRNSIGIMYIIVLQDNSEIKVLQIDQEKEISVISELSKG
jgi:hypothetical protein